MTKSTMSIQGGAQCERFHQTCINEFYKITF